MSTVDRKSLLLGTALASTLVLSSLLVPDSAGAAPCTQPPGTAPIDEITVVPGTPITCVNTTTRIGTEFAIGIATDVDGGYIDLTNSGVLIADNAAGIASGINTLTLINGPNSQTYIDNSGDIYATGMFANGIRARSDRENSPIIIVNNGVLRAIATAEDSSGIRVQTNGDNSRIDIANYSDIYSRALDAAYGIYAANGDADSSIEIANSGEMRIYGSIFAFGIDAESNGANGRIEIANSGDITAISRDPFGYAAGIFAETGAPDSRIEIANSGAITVESEFYAAGIVAQTDNNTNSPIEIANSGELRAYAGFRADGIYASTDNVNNPIEIANSGSITAISRDPFGSAEGIYAETVLENSRIDIANSGDITIEAPLVARGIDTYTYGANSPIEIVNSGNITAESDITAFGMRAFTGDQSSRIEIANSGDIDAQGVFSAYGIYTLALRSRVDVENSGDITAVSDNLTIGIFAGSTLYANTVAIRNSGDITAIGTGATAIEGINSFGSVIIENSGDLTVAGEFTRGIRGFGYGPDASLSIVNSGDIGVTSSLFNAYGVTAVTINADSPILIENRGVIDVVSNGQYGAFGIRAGAYGENNPIDIVNSGDIRATAAGTYFFSEAFGIDVVTVGGNSPITIRNSGNIFADGVYSTGIRAFSGANAIVIVNTGSISSRSLVAINTAGDGPATIYNYGGGVITGAVGLANGADRFFNQAGGTFEARLTSDFGLGNDLFRNEAGGVVHTADNPSVSEYTAFGFLDRFDNDGGLISLVDGRPGDIFRISNTPPQQPNNYFFDSGIVFNGSGSSTLAVDTFLGGPGSTSDIFIIDGDVTGKTKLSVNNTHVGPGVFNPQGIPVVYVGGSVKADAFFLPQPIDRGFFQYDLFFKPVNSGIFELRSFPGGGALLLPQLVTGTQDIWHQGSSTWFDRTADLRVLLAGGAAPIAYDPNGGSAAGPTPFTPAVWARGAGAFIDRDGRETVAAYGRTYTYNLDRDLDVLDWQMGLDLAKRDLFSTGDILVFGVLGGFVGADLDYDQLARNFDFVGGQVGGYATYLRGGLFVDTLLNAHLLELETRTTGFANSLAANTLGLRTDAGYRFGSFSGGAFFEPLATIAVLWSDIEGFTNGGNRVSFDDEANVRGRLGLRVGTSYPVWTGTTMEPFVIGSLWGNLSGDNEATLTSTGTTFRFEDDLDDVWGEVSAGVNFFNPSASTAVFAKLDVTFGDDVDGIGGKAGMRVSW